MSQPLASILFNAQAGELGWRRNPPDLTDLRAIFADIISAELRAGEIIERLRTMLRRGEVELQPVGMHESIDELLRITRSDLIVRGVSVTNLSSSDLPPAMTDRVQLQQVILNLMRNACDAMESNPPGDRLLTLTTFLEKNELRIGVLDCGAGLPDDIESLFQPFHSTRKAAWDGPLNLPHAGELARRQALGGAQGRARRRVLCGAAAGWAGRVSVHESGPRGVR